MAPNLETPGTNPPLNGYITRMTNGAGYVAYRARPICSSDLVDVCRGHRYVQNRYSCNYHRDYMRLGSGRTRIRPVSFRRTRKSRRIVVPDGFWEEVTQAEQAPSEWPITRPQRPIFTYLSQSWTEERDLEQEPKPTNDGNSNNNQTRTVLYPRLRDDPIEEGYTLAKDSEVFLPSDRERLVGPDTNSCSIPSITAEDKEIADLLHLGLLDLGGEQDYFIGLNDVVRPESTYSIRYVTRKRPGKGRRKSCPELWEDDIITVEDAWDWEYV
jgi:hypothetical protein